MYVCVCVWNSHAGLTKVQSTKRAHGEALSGRTASATRGPSIHSCVATPSSSRMLVLSDAHVQNSSWIMNSSDDGIVSRFVLKVSKPSERSVSVR